MKTYGPTMQCNSKTLYRMLKTSASGLTRAIGVNRQ